MARSPTAAVTVVVAEPALLVVSAGFGSAVTVEVTVAVLVITDPTASSRLAWTTTVKVAVAPDAIVPVVEQLMSPLEAPPQDQPPVVGGVTEANVVPAGTESLTVAWTSSLGPLLRA